MISADIAYVADTGPLLCHGTLRNGARRFRSAVGTFGHVSAVRSELERHAGRQGPEKHLRDAAAAWTGQHIGRLGALHDLSESAAAVARVTTELTAWDTARGKPNRHPRANAGEAEAIVAALELGACLVVNDNGAREVADQRGVVQIWNTVDILVNEIKAGAATDNSAFEDYQRMRQRHTDPGEALRGPLDFVRRWGRSSGQAEGN